MQSLQVDYEEATRSITAADDAKPQPWDQVCERFGNDVKRIRTLTDQGGYSALYACYDDDNRPVYFMVEEDAALMKLRRKTFLGKLGRA
jgi:hypothetical protein